MSLDCSKTLDFAKAFTKMCKANDCLTCPLGYLKCEEIKDIRQEEIDAVQKWNDEHEREQEMTDNLFRDYPPGKKVWVLDRYLGNTVKEGEVVELRKIEDSAYITVRCGNVEKSVCYANAPGVFFDTKEEAETQRHSATGKKSSGREMEEQIYGGV